MSCVACFVCLTLRAWRCFRHLRQYFIDLYLEIITPNSADATARRDARLRIAADAPLRNTRLCTRVLDVLHSKSFVGITTPFQLPVDHKALGLVDYERVVKHPMDLSTVRQKLDSGRYRTYGVFVRDMERIVRNALLYNERDRHLVRRVCVRVCVVASSAGDVLTCTLGACRMSAGGVRVPDGVSAARAVPLQLG